MWECPDLFNVNGTDILVLSPEQITKDNINYTNNSVYATVNFDEENFNMSFTSEVQYLDYGLDLYAPQSNIDKNPTVLINGRILSEYYSVSDFKYILNDILETNEI